MYKIKKKNLSLFKIILLVLILVLTVTFYVNAQQLIELEFPLKCTVGKDCWLINYVDNDPSSDWHDYKGARHTYEAHRGTDISIKNLEQMRNGVDVLAAANGIVIATRDSMPDINALKQNRNDLLPVACGNRVAIKHSGDWITDYCHLKRGSISVKKGDYVKAGQKIGEVGLSGLSELPHLHLNVLNSQKFFDPFTGSEMYKTNNIGTPLWSNSALQQMQYKPQIIYNIGITDQKPTWLSMRSQKNISLNSNSPVLMLWVDAFHVEKGDIFEMVIKTPDNTNFVHEMFTLDKSNAKKYLYIGKKKPPNGFKKGIYTAKVTFKRPQTNIYNEEKINFSIY